MKEAERNFASLQLVGWVLGRRVDWMFCELVLNGCCLGVQIGSESVWIVWLNR